MKNAPLTSSTLRPSPDKWFARDGAGVVLNARSDAMLLLRYKIDRWHVTRHRSADTAVGGERRAVEWCGYRYCDTGDPVAELTDADAPDVWARLYRELLEV